MSRLIDYHCKLVCLAFFICLATFIGWHLCDNEWVCDDPNYPYERVQKGNWERSDYHYCVPEKRSDTSSIPAINKPCDAIDWWFWSLLGALMTLVALLLFMITPCYRSRDVSVPVPPTDVPSADVSAPVPPPDVPPTDVPLADVFLADVPATEPQNEEDEPLLQV